MDLHNNTTFNMEAEDRSNGHILVPHLREEATEVDIGEDMVAFLTEGGSRKTDPSTATTFRVARRGSL
jgi:hypothetical protein